jgi:aryl-alcohol dehydrogenase-like predicted oxidoreductase
VRYRQLGRSGLTVSVLGLGTRSFGRTCDEQQAQAVVDEAIELGVTFIDTAASYADGDSEIILGKVLKAKRDDVVLLTKFGGPRSVSPERSLGSRRYIRQAVEESLTRLQTDRIDLYMIHVPDDKTPIEETLDALNDLVREGKVLYLGTSNFEAWRVAEAEWASRSTNTPSRFIAAQNQYSLLGREVEADLVPVCLRYDIGLIPWRPLGAGLLTASGPAASDPAQQARVDAMRSFAADRGISILETAIGGLAAMPAIATVLTGAEKPEEIRANAAASDWVPTVEDLEALKAATA